MIQEDGVNSTRTSTLLGAGVIFSLALFSCHARAQDAGAAAHAPPRDGGTIVELQEQVRQLRAIVEEMRTENSESRAEMRQLRRDLQATRAMLEHPGESSSA